MSNGEYFLRLLIGSVFIAWQLFVFGFVGCQAFAQGQLYIGPQDGFDPKWATRADFERGMPFCRGFYTSDRDEENGSGWYTDYPGGDNNFSVRLGELTKTKTNGHVVVRLTDALLNRCPVLYMSDVGTMRLSPLEIAGLRHYLTAGGFLWVDDFWGDQAWDQWVEEIRKVLPRSHMFDIPDDHPIRRTVWTIQTVRQQPTVGLWVNECDEAGDNCTGKLTSERGEESAVVHFRALEDEKGRLQVVMTHNTDIADGWEDRMDAGEALSELYSLEFSAGSYALGINIFIYALTH